MSTLESIAAQGTNAVKRLRREKLTCGLPFMINDPDLPSGECYLEQPDGTIQLVKLAENRREFELIRHLSENESNDLRTKYGLNV